MTFQSSFRLGRIAIRRPITPLSTTTIGVATYSSGHQSRSAMSVHHLRNGSGIIPGSSAATIARSAPIGWGSPVNFGRSPRGSLTKPTKLWNLAARTMARVLSRSYRTCQSFKVAYWVPYPGTVQIATAYAFSTRHSRASSRAARSPSSVS